MGWIRYYHDRKERPYEYIDYSLHLIIYDKQLKLTNQQIQLASENGSVQRTTEFEPLILRESILFILRLYTPILRAVGSDVHTVHMVLGVYYAPSRVEILSNMSFVCTM
jgi:hypothetical protein